MNSRLRGYRRKTNLLMWLCLVLELASLAAFLAEALAAGIALSALSLLTVVYLTRVAFVHAPRALTRLN